MPKAVSDEGRKTLWSFHEYAMAIIGELLDESMHDVVYDVLRILDREPSEALRYLLAARRGGGMLICGATVDPEVNATTQPAGDGYLILITDRLLALISELAHVHAAVTRFSAEDGNVMEPVMSADQINRRIGKILAWVRNAEPFPETSPWGFDEERSEFASVVYDEIVTFVLAHELAHVLLGHFEPKKTEFREFGTNGILASDELDADALAVRLAARRTTQQGRGTHHFGALFFFQINYMLEVAGATRRNESFRQAVRRMRARASASHPHPLHRSDLALRVGTMDDVGPMELCDGVLETFDAIWHGPRPARNGAGLDNLERHAAGCDADQLNAIFGIRERGFRKLMFDDVRELMEQGGEAEAAAFVSYVALSYLMQVGLQRRCVSGQYQMRLYVIFSAFNALYLNVAHPSIEAVALDVDVRAAIPELGTILDTYSQVMIMHQP